MPTQEPQAIVSIAYVDSRALEDGATGVTWIVSRAKAEAMHKTLTGIWGEPVSMMISGEAIDNMDKNPGLIIHDPEGESHA